MFDDVLYKILAGITEKTKRGNKLQDLSAEEKAEFNRLNELVPGLQKLERQVEITKRQIMLDRDKLWNSIKDKYNFNMDLTVFEGAIYELLD